jgi:hypothetical protein
MMAKTDGVTFHEMRGQQGVYEDKFIRFVDSGGAALKSAENALFGRERLAKDRFQ